MAILGLGNKGKKKTSATKKTKASSSKASGSSKKGSQSDEAKAVLAKMQAKKDSGDCPFC